MKPAKLKYAFLMLLVSCGITLAQAGKDPAQRPSAEVIDDWVIRWEKRIVEVAEAMPADKYSFVPTNGEFKGVRTFAQQLKHLAAANYILAATALGQPLPQDAGDEKGPDSVYTKPDIINYVKGSFAALHKAAASIDDRNQIIKGTPISPLQTTATKEGLVVEALLHTANHYGQMVEYLRMNGVIPPASR